MEIDWQKVSSSLATRIGSATLEADQWKSIAEELFKENNILKAEIQDLKSRESTENDTKDSQDG